MILTGLDSGDVSNPSITCDSDSGIHIVWHDASSGNPDVYYLRGATPGSGILDSRPSPPTRRPDVSATIVRGVLVLGAADSRRKTGYRGDLLDISGRNVLDLHPGANDVRPLAPGVYFVRERLAVGGERPTVRKVIISR